MFTYVRNTKRLTNQKSVLKRLFLHETVMYGICNNDHDIVKCAICHECVSRNEFCAKGVLNKVTVIHMTEIIPFDILNSGENPEKFPPRVVSFLAFGAKQNRFR